MTKIPTNMCACVHVHVCACVFVCVRVCVVCVCLSVCVVCGVCVCVEMRSHLVAQADFELPAVLLPQAPMCRDTARTIMSDSGTPALVTRRILRPDAWTV